MLSLEKIAELLGYSKSEYFRTDSTQFESESRHAHDLLVDACSKSGCKFFGVQMFEISRSKDDNAHIPQSLLCVASASSIENAQALHKLVWNIGSVPFLLIHLPDQIRLYNGFEFDNDDDISLTKLSTPSEQELLDNFSEIAASSITSGDIWNSKLSKELNPQKRIDHRLLQNLDELSKCLRKNIAPQLDANTAHALIGKYIYVKYLRDRGILSDEWLAEKEIPFESVIGNNADFETFRKLVLCLEERFNGKIFELNLDLNTTQISDEHIRLVASVFKGDYTLSTETKVVQQLTFAFANYDFEYIPVETLSIVYQQFLHAEDKGKEKGAFYTPETIAEYVINEVESVKPLTLGDKILDPSCGSGVFLVLAYRRLIEKYRHTNQKETLTPDELNHILLQSIHGVEKDLDACNVASFSLILTMLHYVDPPELHRNSSFKFPSLVGSQIINADFFDPKSKFAEQSVEFDRIIGNPPWFSLNSKYCEHELALNWRNEKRAKTSISVSRIEDAFAWKALSHISDDGVIGLIMPMPSLLNAKFQRFRQLLFKESQFERITNFANIRDELFEGRVSMPAASWIYRRPSSESAKPPIRHYAPMAINQNTFCSDLLWNVTIHESEIQYIDHNNAETGETAVWKFAQWGSHRDIRAYDQLKKLLPMTLQEFCASKGWGDKLPVEGPQFRTSSSTEKREHMPEYEGMPVFKGTLFNKDKFKGQCFTFPDSALEPLDEENCFLRARGGKAGLNVTKAPHLLISAFWKNHLIYSDTDFIVPPRQIGISCPKGDEVYLKALAVFLFSSLSKYCIFYTSPEFGTYGTMDIVVLKEVRKMPVPDFTIEQATQLAGLHQELINEEQQQLEFSLSTDNDNWLKIRQNKVDAAVNSILEIPQNITLVIDDFIHNRLSLNENRKHWARLNQAASVQTLDQYATTLRDELDSFLDGAAINKITIEHSPELTCCRIEVLPDQNDAITPILKEIECKEELIDQIKQQTITEFSPQFYLQKSVKVFEESEILLIKPARHMEWTPSRALCDSDDIIAEILRGC